MIAKSKTEKLYFGPEVDSAIVWFQKETEISKKHEIFVSCIKPAFEKLVNYHYYKTPVARNEDIKSDCLSFLYEQINKFDATKRDRGFPYFNVIVKHFFIQRLKTERKQISNDQMSVSLSDYQSQQNKSDFLLVEDLDEQIENREFIETVKEHLPRWKDQFTKPQEKLFMDAVIALFETSEDVDIYNKKAIFYYLKENTAALAPPGLNSKQIATNLEKLKRKFVALKKKFLRGDV